ncbi:VIT1/CCC1 transporter family protein [Micropruina sp.]|uniref:VIT1/CCC1 transporter family protein n=1 Tax=Micropruina sp. TaxID=2737536 RepID=UPI0039E5157F
MRRSAHLSQARPNATFLVQWTVPNGSRDGSERFRGRFRTVQGTVPTVQGTVPNGSRDGSDGSKDGSERFKGRLVEDRTPVATHYQQSAGTLLRVRGTSWRERLRIRIDPASVRGQVENVNDGILAISGFSQGLYGGDELNNLWSPIMAMAAFAGALSIFCVTLSSGLADRDAELLVAEEEQRLLALAPDEQIAELAEYYEGKGLTTDTAHRVAEELTATDSLAAHLEIEGFDEPTTISSAIADAFWAGVAFLLGATVPILISIVAPGLWRDSYTAVAVAVALAITSVVLARLGQTRIWQTLLRSVFIGLAALGSSYLVGLALL